MLPIAQLVSVEIDVELGVEFSWF